VEAIAFDQRTADRFGALATALARRVRRSSPSTRTWRRTPSRWAWRSSDSRRRTRR